MQMKGDGQTTK